MKKALSVLLLLAAFLPCLAQEPAGTDFTAPTETNNNKVRSDGIDNVLEYTPFAALFALKAIGVESKSEWGRLAVNAATSFVITAGACYAMKHTIHTMRPDRSDNHSFPSGHSAIAFAGATLLAKEYGHVSPWIAVGGYAVATVTAVDRVHRDRHHWGDVVAGAALGVAAAEAGYYLGRLILPDRESYSLSVSPMGMSLVVKL
ncbi:MAG: phosphatase PAP2 family protein [Prevotella sp.]|uniref:phosphatase PAP2 family protein n=1 Tax=Prevotella sp. TaxID=59823 RepID=UPI002A2FE699|nr:phosphatase PAP2 family protein [Prevotella sp.]MDD7317738.1 phosphatase PAP2 family protein [Prevotellaceae bacterium]MDY4020653.1 phosphatase PAP2 family protein [Prevotella sp.]